MKMIRKNRCRHEWAVPVVTLAFHLAEGERTDLDVPSRLGGPVSLSLLPERSDEAPQDSPNDRHLPPKRRRWELTAP